MLTRENLPKDILRLIIESIWTIPGSRKDILNLACVSSSFKSWIDPLLYRNVVLFRESHIASFILALDSAFTPSPYLYTRTLWILCAVPSRLSGVFEASIKCPKLHHVANRSYWPGLKLSNETLLSRLTVCGPMRGVPPMLSFNSTFKSNNAASLLDSYTSGFGRITQLHILNPDPPMLDTTKDTYLVHFTAIEDIKIEITHPTSPDVGRGRVDFYQLALMTVRPSTLRLLFSRLPSLRTAMILIDIRSTHADHGWDYSRVINALKQLANDDTRVTVVTRSCQYAITGLVQADSAASISALWRNRIIKSLEESNERWDQCTYSLQIHTISTYYNMLRTLFYRINTIQSSSTYVM